MKKQILLNGGEVLISDQKKAIAIYPYRDSDATKVTLDTKEVLIEACGVPGIDIDKIRGAAVLARDYLSIYCFLGD